MKRIVLSLVAAASLAGAALPAFAQGPRPSDWQPLRERQANIEERIDQGVRSGELSRHEARGLRRQFEGLIALEDREKAEGHFGVREREDLQRRYDALSARIHFEKHDG